MRRWLVAAVAAMAAVVPAQALELNGTLSQGGLVIGQTVPGTIVRLDGRPVHVDAGTGTFVLGFGRDAATTAELVLVSPDGERAVHALEIAQRDYDIQRIDGLPPRHITPSDEDLARIRREGRRLHAARARDGDEMWFRQGFAWPVRGRISGVYGSQRVLNGEPRRPHLGIDIAAPAGTPVVAAAPGRVAFADPDLFYTGGTVVLDHGHGVTTIYSHLQDVAATEGAEVERGAVIGTVGSTGRSTGPHLDWRVNWFQTRLDPALIAGAP